MRVVDLYRRMLFLYPVAFRDQFSEEMVSVFQQRAVDGPGTFSFFIREFLSVAKGACTMWLEKILTFHHNPALPEAADPTGTPTSIAEVNSLRQAAIAKMVASIATHDFLNARRYSNEEIRLNLVLRDLERGSPTPGGETAQ